MPNQKPKSNLGPGIKAYYLPDRESKTDVGYTDQGVIIQH